MRGEVRAWQWLVEVEVEAEHVTAGDWRMELCSLQSHYSHPHHSISPHTGSVVHNLYNLYLINATLPLVPMPKLQMGKVVCSWLLTHVPGCPRLVGLTVHCFNSEHNLHFAFLSLLKYWPAELHTTADLFYISQSSSWKPSTLFIILSDILSASQ